METRRRPLDENSALEDSESLGAGGASRLGRNGQGGAALLSVDPGKGGRGTAAAVAEAARSAKKRRVFSQVGL